MADPIAGYLDRLALKAFSTHTLRAYAGDLRQAEAALGAPLHLVDEQLLEAYAAGLARRLKAATVKRKHSALRGFFEYCRRTRPPLREDDPTIRFDAPRQEKRLPVYLTDAQVEQLLAVLRHDTPAGRREAAIVRAFVFTGMRAGELRDLNVEDLQLAERQLRVFGKGRKERTLPISPSLGSALWAWLDVHPTKTGPLFIRLDGDHGRLSYDAVADVIRRAVARAGLPQRITCHKLRHTFATRLINRKVSIDKIQKLLGHARIDTTTIYAHTELGADLIAELGDALEGRGS